MRFLAWLVATFWCGLATAHEAGQHIHPLGDGKVSRSPRSGYVYSCMSEFQGGGAEHQGGWINGSSWDESGKISVQGRVFWQAARFSIEEAGGVRKIRGNGLPLAHPTGTFPVRFDDPAYRIDRNPNRIEAQEISLELPLHPEPAETPGCLPMGMIGVALDGVAIFNALDDAGRDAVAHEVQDLCNGHPQGGGEYHYHGPSPCIPGARDKNALIGYALDGFGIYSGWDENGREIRNSDLDECHGRVSPVLWDGKTVNIYHYVLTAEYPYTLGCFRGTAVRARSAAPDFQRPSGRRRPPLEAIEACAGKAPDSSCEFVSPRGDSIRGRCASPGGAFACVPRF